MSQQANAMRAYFYLLLTISNINFYASCCKCDLEMEMDKHERQLYSKS